MIQPDKHKSYSRKPNKLFGDGKSREMDEYAGDRWRETDAQRDVERVGERERAFL